MASPNFATAFRSQRAAASSSAARACLLTSTCRCQNLIRFCTCHLGSSLGNSRFNHVRNDWWRSSRHAWASVNGSKWVGVE